MDKLKPVSDNRAGYQRQKDEPAFIYCGECGARVMETAKGLTHAGPCSPKKENNSRLANQ